jgi:hypothetical protein
MSAIGAGAKELPRQGDRAGLLPAEQGAIWGMSRPLYTRPYLGQGAKNGRPMRPGLRGWDIGTPPQSAGNGHWWWLRPPGIIPGPKSPSAASRRWRSQRLAKGGARSQTKPGGGIAGGSQSCPWAARGNRQQYHDVLANISKACFASRIMLRSAASLSDPNERTEPPL